MKVIAINSTKSYQYSQKNSVKGNEALANISPDNNKSYIAKNIVANFIPFLGKKDDDIELAKKREENWKTHYQKPGCYGTGGYSTKADDDFDKYERQAQKEQEEDNLAAAEHFCNRAIESGKIAQYRSKDDLYRVRAKLAEILLLEGKHAPAKDVYNSLVEEDCYDIVDSCDRDNYFTLKEMKAHSRTYTKWEKDCEALGEEWIRYNKATDYGRKKVSVKKPAAYPELKSGVHTGHCKYEISKRVASYYDKLAIICAKLGEPYPAKVCRAAAQDIEDCTPRGDKVIKVRAAEKQYIGNLYPEIKSE